MTDHLASYRAHYESLRCPEAKLIAEILRSAKRVVFLFDSKWSSVVGYSPSINELRSELAEYEKLTAKVIK